MNIQKLFLKMETTTTPQAEPVALSPSMKHYYKNKTKVLAYYASYYQANKERIKANRKARYIPTKKTAL